MPHIIFTVEEIANSLLDALHATSTKILELSDLSKKPLDPGESVAARHHKIAKLGKLLAETYQSLHLLMHRGAEEPDGDPAEPSAQEPQTPTRSQAN